ncbi:hypothetical protein ACVWZZ_002647 [Bradyrhizobium sp. LM6.10]
MLRLDHITVAAKDLAEGVAYVEQALGIAPPAGGAHPLMGTHNHLLRLSETAFLEVIAPNPSAPAPTRPRWFAMDDPRTHAALASSPRLMTWVVSTSDIASALAKDPASRPAGDSCDARQSRMADLRPARRLDAVRWRVSDRD